MRRRQKRFNVLNVKVAYLDVFMDVLICTRSMVNLRGSRSLPSWQPTRASLPQVSALLGKAVARFPPEVYAIFRSITVDLLVRVIQKQNGPWLHANCCQLPDGTASPLSPNWWERRHKTWCMNMHKHWVILVVYESVKASVRPKYFVSSTAICLSSCVTRLNYWPFSFVMRQPFFIGLYTVYISSICLWAVVDKFASKLTHFTANSHWTLSTFNHCH